MRPFPAEFRSWATDEPQSHTQISLCRLAWDCPMPRRGPRGVPADAPSAVSKTFF